MPWTCKACQQQAVPLSWTLQWEYLLRGGLSTETGEREACPPVLGVVGLAVTNSVQQLVACRRRTQEVVDKLHADGVPAVREALGLDAAGADTAAAGTSQLSVCSLLLPCARA